MTVYQGIMGELGDRVPQISCKQFLDTTAMYSLIRST